MNKYEKLAEHLINILPDPQEPVTQLQVLAEVAYVAMEVSSHRLHPKTRSFVNSQQFFDDPKDGKDGHAG